MAGRKPRLYDTVKKQWVEFSSLLEADDFFKDKEKNPFVKTKEFGLSSRYSYSEPVDNIELATIAVGGKPKSKNSGAAQVYKKAKPNIDLDNLQNLVGINPLLDKELFKKHPAWRPLDKPLYYPATKEYWGYNDLGEYTNDIPENKIGSSARRRLQAESKDLDEEQKKWLSEYYKFLEGGVDNMSLEAQVSYNNLYAKKNLEAITAIPGYNPNTPYIVKGRALTSLAGKNAIDNYIEEIDVPKNHPLRKMSGISNTDLARLSERDSSVGEVFNDIMDYYMLKYYGNISKQYEDDPINIQQDIAKNGDAAKIRESLPKNMKSILDDPNSNGFRKMGVQVVGTITSLGNELVNNYGVQLRNTFSPDDIKNEQRERANNVINLISERQSLKALLRYDGDIEKDSKDFDKLASHIYGYYTLNDLSEEYSPEEKLELLTKYSILSQVIGEEQATQNLLKELQNRDNKWTLLTPFKNAVFTSNNLLNTIATTVGHIANMTWYAPLAIWDVGLAAASAVNGENFLDVLGNELYDTWNRSLDNDFVNYLGDVESTGSWLTKDINIGGLLRSQEYYKQRGINANKVLRDYGKDDTLWDVGTLYDIVPVAGYMIGSAVGSKGLNMVSKVMSGVSKLSKAGSVAAGIGELSSTGAKAFGYKSLSIGASISSKFLKGASTFIDATAPSVATAGMDYGYAKLNYDLGLQEAEQYINSPEFRELASEQLVKDNLNEEDLETIIYNSLVSDSFRDLALLLMLDHNSKIIKEEDEWSLLDAAKELLIQKYKDEYLEEAKKIATINAGITFGLTLLPDIHITNTWRKAMYSAESRNAMNALARKTLFKPIGKVLGINPRPVEDYIEKIVRKDGKWFVEGKPLTRGGLFKMYADQSKAGFVSNYLQDVGVAAGQGFQEALLSQYIDLRFNREATDNIAYDLTHAWVAAAARAGLAFGEYTSFRDGLYGALAPWVISPARGVGDIAKGIKDAKAKGKWSFAKSLITEPILKNSLLYNSTFGAKDIINKENLRRQAINNSIETWLNSSNAAAYLDNMGSLLELSKQEKLAIEKGDFAAFQNSKMGNIVTAAMMLSLLKNHQPIRQTMLAYMLDRANREEVNQSDIDRLEAISIEFAALKEQNTEFKKAVENNPNDEYALQALEESNQEIQEFLYDLDVTDRSIISDLVQIRKLSLDLQAKDSRPEFKLLNDLRKNARTTLQLINKVEQYMVEADAVFGENSDIVLKLEYTRLKLYQELLKSNIEEKTELINDIEKDLAFSKEEASVNSTVDLNDELALFIADYKSNIEKVVEDIESTEQNLRTLSAKIYEVKNSIEIAGSKSNDAAINKQVLDVLKYQKALLQLKLTYLRNMKKNVERRKKNASEEDVEQKAVIAAKDIVKLSDIAKLKLLTSKNLSAELQAEVQKFLATADFSRTSEILYVDLLQSKINSQNILNNLMFEGQLTLEAVLRLQSMTQQARIELYRDLYAKSFESFADEHQYYFSTFVDNTPNVSTIIINAPTDEQQEVQQADASLPAISVALSELEAYEKFVNAYNEKVKEIQNQEDSLTLMLGLHKALKETNNSLYQKMLDNEKENDKAVQDLNKYIDPKLFNTEEKRELSNILEFATINKGLGATDILKVLTSLSDEFMLDLKTFLESRGFTPGTILNLRDRIIKYNFNVTKTIEDNKKAEEERTKKQEEHKEVKDTKKKASDSRFVQAINAIATYTAAEKDKINTPMRELLKTIGVMNAYDVKSYSNNMLDAFRLIILDSEASNLEELEKALDENFNKLKEDENVQLSDNEMLDLSIFLDLIKAYVARKEGSFKTYKNADFENSAEDKAKEERKSLKLNTVNSGVPYSFADLSWIDNSPENQENNVLWKKLHDAHVDDFLRNYTVTPDTKLVFLTSRAWLTSVAERIKEKAKNKDADYNAADALPVIGAIKLTQYRDGCIIIKNPKTGEEEYYLPLGVLPSVSKVANTTIIRRNAIKMLESNLSNDAPFVVKEVTSPDSKDAEKELSTTITVKQEGVTINTDGEPHVLELKNDAVITANNFYYTEEGNNPTVKTNQVPSINKKETSRANWTPVLIQEIDSTENEEGKKLEDLEGASVINFNSRTQGFAEALLRITDKIKENPANFEALIKSLNVNSVTASSLLLNTSLNSKVGNDADNVALASFISLANGYNYRIHLLDGDVKLYISKKENPNDSRSKETIVGNIWTLISDNQENITPTSQIIKDLSALKYKDNLNKEIPVAKWQVNFKNFELTQKPSPLKVEYIKKAIKDRILYAYDVEVSFDILITPVQDSYAKEEIALKNAEAEKRAALKLLDDSTNPVTGETNNPGVDFEGVISLIQDFSLDGEIKDKMINSIIKLLAVKTKVEAKRDAEKTKKEKEGLQSKIAINQTLIRNSTTGTTVIANGKETPEKPKKPTKETVIAFVGGNVADDAVRRFFDPLIDRATLKQLFIEDYKDVFNATTVNNLWEALVNLNQTFIDNGWHIISRGVYTIEEKLNDKPVGETDLFYIDNFGNFGIIDIKTHSGEFKLVTEGENGHNYPNLVSMYRADMMRNNNMFIPEKNLHIYSLKLEMDKAFYKVSEGPNGIYTVVKDKKYASEIQIKKNARFEYHLVEYVGDAKIEELFDKRLKKGQKLALELIEESKNVMEIDAEPQALLEEITLELEVIEDELTPEELEMLTQLALAEANQTLTLGEYLTIKTTQELENLGCGK